MLTEDELAALESLLVRARAAAGADRSESGGAVNVGDLVQLRPGADSHWQTSLLLVCKIRDDGRVSGVVLRPHRSGSRDAWYTYSVPEVLRIGRAPFPPPESAVNSAGFLATCPRCLGRDGVAPPASRAAGGHGDQVARLPAAEVVRSLVPTGPIPAWPKAKPKPASVKKAKAMVALIEASAGPNWKSNWKSHLQEICAKFDAADVSRPPKWPSWSGQLAASATPQSYAATLVLLNIARYIEVYEDLQNGAAPLPEPKPIQRETRGSAAIQIGPRLWWVMPA